MAQTNITLTTWNILNPAYAKLSYYSEHVHKYLNWNEGRKVALHNYIKTINSDIYCLQESTEKIADEITTVLMNNSNRNYVFIWAKRKSDADDGCAIIYDRDVLNLSDVKILRHNNTHIIQCALFENITNKNKFWVLNTHVNFMTRNEDIIAMLQTTNKDQFYNTKRIIVGDFNAEIKELWYTKLNQNSYIDAWTEKNGPHQKSDFTYSNGDTHRNKWIDFVLMSGFVYSDIDKVYINADLTNMTYAPNDQIPSDHVPQSITFKL